MPTPAPTLPLNLDQLQASWLYTVLQNAPTEYKNRKTEALIAQIEQMPFPKPE
jgi:hypothetical protein